MEGGDCFKTLIGHLESAIEQIPDPRVGNNKTYSLLDTAFSAFSVFFTQSPSFLSYQRSMQQNQGNNNGRTLFNIKKIPSDNQIRTILDQISPQSIEPVYHSVFNFLQEKKVINEFRSFNDNLLLALDGTWFFSSKKIHCNHCLTKQHKDGTTTYYHSAITPTIVAPHKKTVIPLPQEFITPQDGSEKQDCENAAAKRWLERNGEFFSTLKTTILGDDLYARQPICSQILEKGLNFLFVCKPSSHRWLTEWLENSDPDQDLHRFTVKQWNGKERRFYTYEYVNGAPLRDSDDALLVNWAKLTITKEDGAKVYRNSFITNHEITRDNVISLIEAGRCRWKIENENNNTLKTKGYNLEHNFGHGEKELSNLLLSLNILAYLFHTVLEYFDRRYLLIRKTLPRRDTFFHDIKALTRYLCFDSWDDMLIFMLKGLKLEDPG